MREDRIFDFAGNDVLSATDHQFTNTSGEPKVAVLIQMAEIAHGVVPGRPCLLGGGGILDEAAHAVRSPGEDSPGRAGGNCYAVRVAYAQFGSRQRTTDAG